MDSAGDQHLHIDHNIYKRRVDLHGNPIEEAKKEDISVPSTKKPETVHNIIINHIHQLRVVIRLFFPPFYQNLAKHINW